MEDPEIKIEPSVTGNDDATSAVPDPSSIILPQKGLLSLDSAMRAPAGEVLKAANVTEERPAPATPKRLEVPQTLANASPNVPALHTFRGDVATTIEERHISLADIAQAQSARRGIAEPSGPPGSWVSRNWWRITEVAIGLVLLVSAMGALVWAYQRLQPLPAPIAVNAPYIYVDTIKRVDLPLDTTHATLMDTLVGRAGSDTLSLGLVEQLALSIASTTPGAPSVPMTTRTFFSLMAPQAPDLLVRSLGPQFLLGLHSYGGNQPFLIFKTDSYEQAFAGMLQWEYTLRRDVSPLFASAVPAPSPVPITNISATTSSATTTGASTTVPVGPIASGSFVDTVIDNQDARAIIDGNGNVVLLWTFVDRQTLVLAGNASTLLEVISRLQKAPTLTLPK